MAPPLSPPGVRVLDRIRVSPPPPLPDSALPLTFFDVAWLFTGPVERLFFYCHPDPAAALALLRSSLPVALCRFYPLAGTIRPHPPFLCSYTLAPVRNNHDLNLVLSLACRIDMF